MARAAELSPPLFGVCEKINQAVIPESSGIQMRYSSDTGVNYFECFLDSHLHGNDVM